jgi:hypothetical protein
VRLGTEAPGDPVEPGRDLGIPAESLEVLKRGEERLLEHLAGGFLRTAHPQTEAVDVFLVTGQESLHGRWVAPAHPLQQLGLLRSHVSTTLHFYNTTRRESFFTGPGSHCHDTRDLRAPNGPFLLAWLLGEPT